MKPLQSVGMGLVIVVLTAKFNGYDALPDPLGWLLVLAGVHALPEPLAQRGTLLTLAGLAGAVSVAVWIPSVTDALYDADPSLGWAANLPQIGFTAVLCHALAVLATEAGDQRPARWLRVNRTFVIAVGLLPILVFGAGVESLEVTSYVLAGASVLMLIWLLFSYASRPWAGAPTAEAPTERPLAS
ncbi:hypothetical protein [Nocardioides sp.]|uniref:hypothetical protein n=1 Tax=Nocardioides sp. TaxID=35761 RepID=UPI0031FE763C